MTPVHKLLLGRMCCFEHAQRENILKFAVFVTNFRGSYSYFRGNRTIDENSNYTLSRKKSKLNK